MAQITDEELLGSLKTCPFCGNETLTLWVDNDGHGASIECSCGVLMDGNSINHAISRWNRRHTGTVKAQFIALYGDAHPFGAGPQDSRGQTFTIGPGGSISAGVRVGGLVDEIGHERSA